MHSSYVQFVIPKATSSAVALPRPPYTYTLSLSEPLTKITHLKNVHVSLPVLHHRPTAQTEACTLAPSLAAQPARS